MLYDRYKFGWRKENSIDCIMLTLNAEKHLRETLTTWYREAPIHKLYVIDGGSTDKTHEILKEYPRIKVLDKPGMTTGKAFELLKNMVQTPCFIWIDVGKIPAEGWYDEVQKHIEDADIVGTKRINYYNGKHWEDPIVKNPDNRLLGGPWFIHKNSMKNYHVDDDYAQRNIDIIIRQVIELDGGRYKLVSSTYHTCYLPNQIVEKNELERRMVQNAKGIVKYINLDYARQHAKYLLNDHWMLMINNLDRQWVYDTSVPWYNELKHWRRHRLVFAKIIRFIYHRVLKK